MQQHGQATGHRHHGSLLGGVSAALRQTQPEAAQLCVGTEGPENVVGRRDQQAAQQGIPGRVVDSPGDNVIAASLCSMGSGTMALTMRILLRRGREEKIYDARRPACSGFAGR